MDLNQLRGFLTVAEEGSFTKAAKRLFVTQPALSLQIKALEERLGEQLFERRGRTIRLTPAGRVLQGRAVQIFTLVEQTTQEMASLNGLKTGQVVIGAGESPCLYLLPPLIQFFHEQFPGIFLRFVNRHSAEIVDLVKEGVVDFGLVTLPVRDAQLQVERLCWREDVVICHPSHPLNGQKRVMLADLLPYPWLLIEQKSHSHRLLMGMLDEVGAAPAGVMELSSVEVIKQFVKLELGISIVPGFTVREEMKRGELGMIRLDWLPERGVGVIQRKKGYVSPAGQVFLKLLKNHLTGFILAPAEVGSLAGNTV